MKSYILTAKIKVTDESIRKARKWEKRGNYKYGDNVAHLLMDCMADGKDIEHEIQELDIEDVNANQLDQTLKQVLEGTKKTPAVSRGYAG